MWSCVDRITLPPKARNTPTIYPELIAYDKNSQLTMACHAGKLFPIEKAMPAIPLAMP